MATLKCKMCGGTLVLIEGTTICECEYCGSQQTVPVADNEKKMTLYERANRLRYNCEFDKASSVYENIISEFHDEAEAYWGNLLCKYGIEYVDDPADGHKVPTCHRSSFESFMEEPDFEMVMEYAMDSLTRNLYREQAKQIEEIRKGIIEVSGKEKPYDIFICCKETAEDGQRTEDSVLAQDVYDALTEKGYRVFFSRITLEDKLGTEYEPYIFAALNSAKVMLAFGTSYDYYNAIWVKNEWSRYLKLMAKDKNKHLIPCYKNLDAYDIPKEFARLQAQDLGKVGAIQDLLRGVEKIVQQESKADDKVVELIKSANEHLQAKAWEKAREAYEYVQDLDATNVDAALGLLLTDSHACSLEEMSVLPPAINKNENYRRIQRYGSDEVKTQLNDAIVKVKNRGKRRVTILSAFVASVVVVMIAFVYLIIPGVKYMNAKGEMKKGNYEIAEAAFTSLGSFLNAEAMVIESRYQQATSLMQSGDYGAAKIIFSKLGDYKDSAEKVAFCADGMLVGPAKSYISQHKYKEAVELLNSILEIPEASIVLSELYSEGQALYNSGKEMESMSIFIAFTENEAAQNIVSQYYSSLLSTARVGDIICFGQYEQDNNSENGAEPIEWIVCDKKENKLLLVSHYVIEGMQFVPTTKSNKSTWKGSEIRSWLNESFFFESFSDYEQMFPVATWIENGKNPQGMQDKLFLLSVEEVEKYFSSDIDRKCSATDYAKSHGEMYLAEQDSYIWWLRSPGITSGIAEVSREGSINYNGYLVYSKFGVRPAMWISLDEVK